MTQEELYEALGAYKKNLEYSESNLFYPNLTTSQRKEIMTIHDEVFNTKTVITVQCNKCVLPYVKKLSEWYNSFEIIIEKEEEKSKKKTKKDESKRTEEQ